MNLRKVNKLYVLCSALMLLLYITGCKSNITFAKKKLPAGVVTVHFSDNNYESRSAAVYKPGNFTNSDISKYVLEGEYSGDNSLYSEEYTKIEPVTFSTYGDLTSYTRSLVEGLWNFNLKAYKTINSTDVLVLENTEEKTISQINAGVEFNLQPVTEGTGYVNISIEFPGTIAPYVLFKFEKVDLTEKKLVSVGETVNAETEPNGDLLTAKASNIAFEVGQYVLTIEQYGSSSFNAEEKLNTFNVVFFVQAGNVTNINNSYTNLKEKYRLEFNKNNEGADFKATFKTVVYYSTYDYVKLPTINCFETVPSGASNFVGWASDSDGNNKVIDWNPGTYKTDMTLYAVWSGNPVCTVSFETNGGTLIDSITAQKGDKLNSSLFNTEKPGYSFAGWYADEELTTPFDFENTTVEDDITLYTKWASCYKINFLDSGKSIYSGTAAGEIFTPDAGFTGSISIPKIEFDTASMALEEDKTYAPVFAGWYVDSDCTIPLTENGTEYTLDLGSHAETDYTFDSDNKTLNIYAKWNYKRVYIDPQSETASDEGFSGASSDAPVKTVDEAKRLTCNDSTDDVIFVMSQINTKENVEKLSNTQAVVKRHKDNNSYIIRLPAVESIELSNVVLDGGYDGSDTTNKYYLIFANTDAKTYMKTLTFTDVVFQNNYGYSAVFLSRLGSDKAAVTFTDCTFQNNSGSSSGTVTGTTRNGGGAVFSAGKTVTFDGCTFKNNHTTSYGGAILMGSGTHTFKNENIFEENSAERGGAVAGFEFTGTDATFKFVSNTAEYGAAFYVVNSSKPTFINSVFEGNEATGSEKSACIVNQSSFSNCQFKGNKTQNESVVYIPQYSSSSISDCTFENNKGVCVNSISKITFSGTNLFTNEAGVTVPNIKLDAEATVSGSLYAQNGISMTVGQPITIGDDGLSVISPYTKVATIIPSEYTEGAQVLTMTDSAQKDLFELSDEEYVIDAEGKIKSKNSTPGGGSITLPEAETVSFTANADTLNLGDSLTITPGKEVSDWKLSVVYMGIDTVEISSSVITANANGSISITLSEENNFFAGSYVFNVSAVYKGIRYSSAIPVTIKEVE